MKEMVGGCCVCSDERGWTENPLVYCDGPNCNVAVHQACYGIIHVPSGPWFCRKCESQERAAKVKCDLCPQREGALKKTDTGSWCHVVCALFIPEAWFGNVQTMEPIILKGLPLERFGKAGQACYICEESGREGKATSGACMQCNKNGCRQHFHVTCAQQRGLLCEEQGTYADNVKYCGYCAYHYKKLKKDSHIKQIPAFKPIENEELISPEGSPEKPFTLRWDKMKGGKSDVYDFTIEDELKLMKKADADKSNNSNKEESKDREKDDKSSEKEEPPKSVLSEPKLKLTSLNSSVETNRKKNAKNKQGKDGKPRNSNSSSKSAEKSEIVPTTTSVLNVCRPSDNTLVASKFTTANFVEMTITPSPANLGELVSERKKSNNLKQSGSPNSGSDVGDSSPLSLCEKEKENRDISPVGRIASARSSFSMSSNMSSSNSSVNSPELDQTPNTTLSVTDLFTNTTTSSSASVMDATKTTLSSLDATNNYDFARINSADSYDSTPEQPSDDDRASPFPLSAHSIEDIANSLKRPCSRSSEKLEHTMKKQKCPRKSPNLHVDEDDDDDGEIHVTSPAPSPPVPLLMSKKFIKDDIDEEPPDIMCDAAPPTLSPNVPSCIPSLVKEVKPDIRSSSPIPLLKPASKMLSSLSDSSRIPVKSENCFGIGADSSTTELIMNGLPSMTSSVMPPSKSYISFCSPKLMGVGALSENSSGASSSLPTSMEQLLERQWEQGSQFLMEQGQHFDIASLLNCLHQLRQENQRLEEHITALTARRDHLLAVNARLSLPLQPIAPSSGTLSQQSNGIQNANSSLSSNPLGSHGTSPDLNGNLSSRASRLSGQYLAAADAASAAAQSQSPSQGHFSMLNSQSQSPAASQIGCATGGTSQTHSPEIRSLLSATPQSGSPSETSQSQVSQQILLNQHLSPEQHQALLFQMMQHQAIQQHGGYSNPSPINITPLRTSATSNNESPSSMKSSPDKVKDK